MASRILIAYRRRLDSHCFGYCRDRGNNKARGRVGLFRSLVPRAVKLSQAGTTMVILPRSEPKISHQLRRAPQERELRISVGDQRTNFSSSFSHEIRSRVAADFRGSAVGPVLNGAKIRRI